MKRILIGWFFVCLTTSIAVAAEPTAVSSSDAKQLMEQADVAWSKDDLAGAEKLFKEATDKATDGQAQLRLAGFYLAQTRLDEAVDGFKNAISAGLPTPAMQSRAFIGMGFAYMHSQKTALAKASFEEAVRIDPSRETQVRDIITRMEEKEQGLGTSSRVGH